MTPETCLAYANFWHAQVQVQAIVGQGQYPVHLWQLFLNLKLNLLGLVYHHWVLLEEVERQKEVFTLQIPP